jgi:hypothetical protein
MPGQVIPTGRLATYLFVAGALPGAALANASSMFFKTPPPYFFLDGLVAGGLVGVLLALMIVRMDRPKAA